eukprot:Mycagemm_TRINITY_DN10139_c0_g1::TRINITY_DN10139_c0_g1_i1::g.5266::m.5266 type:complete len:130 gc:universal TRINITY_DN10139_c0_g1_i1:1252-863(-)
MGEILIPLLEEARAMHAKARRSSTTRMVSQGKKIQLTPHNLIYGFASWAVGAVASDVATGAAAADFGASAAGLASSFLATPQQALYFLPLLQGHGSLRPTFGSSPLRYFFGTNFMSFSASLRMCSSFLR